MFQIQTLFLFDNSKDYEIANLFFIENFSTTLSMDIIQFQNPNASQIIKSFPPSMDKFDGLQTPLSEI